MWRSIINPLMFFIIIGLKPLLGFTITKTEPEPKILLTSVLVSCEKYNDPFEPGIKEKYNVEHPKKFEFQLLGDALDAQIIFFTLEDPKKYMGQLSFYGSIRSIHMENDIMSIIVDGSNYREQLKFYFAQPLPYNIRKRSRPWY